MAESMDITTDATSNSLSQQNDPTIKKQEDVRMGELGPEGKPVKYGTREITAGTELPPDTFDLPPTTEAQEQHSAEKPLSKNALKRIRRQQAWEERKKDRKLKDKLKKQAKKEERAKERQAALQAKENSEESIEQNDDNGDTKGGDVDDSGVSGAGQGQKRKARENREGLEMTKKQKFQTTVVPITLIIDCGFDELMHDKEIISLSSQITRSYSDNRNARFQVQLSITSLNKRLKHRMETTLKNAHRNWKRVEFSEDDYEVTPENKDSLIYLSSDSDYTLEELEEGKTYIVGGIVDRNRHKLICYKKATKQGIKTAKLPIGEYIRMASRVVLTTNQVVEIMLKWLECRNWQEAFLKVIPQRKGPEARKLADAKAEDQEVNEEEDAGEDSEGDKGWDQAGDDEEQAELKDENEQDDEQNGSKNGQEDLDSEAKEPSIKVATDKDELMRDADEVKLNMEDTQVKTPAFIT